MTHTYNTQTLLKTLGIAVIAILFLTGTASAGTLFIDTTGLTGKVGETIPVPVKVANANKLAILQLECVTGETADYKIVINGSSMPAQAKVAYNQTTGIIAMLDLGISGDTTLFYLDVTPKTANNINLAISATKIGEGDTGEKKNIVSYKVNGATLAVTGSGQPATPSQPSTPTPSQTATQTPLPTATATATPSATATQTVVPTSTPSETVTPTETVPTLPPATGETPVKTPAPLFGLLVGLGAAICIARR